MSPGRNPMMEWVLYLPVTDNEGNPFPESAFDQVRDELVERFGGCTFDPVPKDGFWMHEGKLYEDRVVTYEVWMPRTPENFKWLKGYRKTLSKRFQQIAVGTKIRPIELPE